MSWAVIRDDGMLLAETHLKRDALAELDSEHVRAWTANGRYPARIEKIVYDVKHDGCDGYNEDYGVLWGICDICGEILT